VSGGSECAVVGGGLAGFTAYATLIRGGIPAEEITVFDATGADPAGAWRRRAAAIRQRRMRSESNGHCLPTSFPGLAMRSAWRERSVWPLVESACDRYHPTVEEFLEHVEELRSRLGWETAVVRSRVERVCAGADGFSLDGHGTFRHVLLAPGPAALNVPEELAGDARTVHAYEPHEYADDVAVVGAGMAAATEWRNALAAGARVTSVRRREPVRRPLSVPRPLLSRRGLGAFHATAPPERAAILETLLAPSYPPGREWDEPLEQGGERFRVEAEVNGEAQIICATGFRRGFGAQPLLAQLVAEHRPETHGDWIVLAPDCTVPALTNDERTLALAGVAAQWAYPAADTLAGAKYAAHGFLRAVQRCRTR
jgi:cation diffusion facilitator CzcD-associated flavoprotein CzcO